MHNSRRLLRHTAINSHLIYVGKLRWEFSCIPCIHPALCIFLYNVFLRALKSLGPLKPLESLSALSKTDAPAAAQHPPLTQRGTILNFAFCILHSLSCPFCPSPRITALRCASFVIRWLPKAVKLQNEPYCARLLVVAQKGPM